MKQNSEKSKQEVSQESLEQPTEELREETLETITGGFGHGGLGSAIKMGIGFSAGSAIFQTGMNLLTGGGQPQQPQTPPQPTSPQQ
jgi:hypothetical protein